MRRGLWAALCTTMLIACSDGDASTTPDAGSTDDPAPVSPDAATVPEPASDAAAPTMDASAEDAGTMANDAQVDAEQPPAEPALPDTLAETGLYAPGSTEELAPGVLAYEPAYALWSDAADKKRWLQLPEGTQIDTSDMDYWSFPVGTKSWKEFSKDGKRLETRLLWKTELGWFRVAYIWNEAGTTATIARDGAENVLGTAHDVPEQGDCGACHDGVTDRLLGVGAVQLSGSRPGLTLGQLIADGRLSDPPVADFALPAELAWNALGYLHANCGTCHNPRGEAFDRLDMDLWLRTDQLAAVGDTESYKTSVGVALTDTEGPENRIEPGSPVDSGMIFRMSMRGSEESMPPLGSEQADDDGITLISDWIDTL